MKSRICCPIISLLFLLMAIPADLSACVDYEDWGYYYAPFNVDTTPKTSDAPSRAYQETIDFWNYYTGGNVSKDDIKNYFDHADYTNFKNKDYRLYRYLDEKNDWDAIEYIENCLQLSRLVDAYAGELWNYNEPSPDEILDFIRSIENVDTSSPLQPRYELLKIRGYGAIKDNDGVMKVWNRVGPRLKASPFRDRMAGYVGGVLYREGKYAEALDYFKKSGDTNSIQWCVEKLAGSDNLANLYHHDPTSPAIPYIIQDYINYLMMSSSAGRELRHETVKPREFDQIEEDDIPEIMDDINKMTRLCREVLADGKTDNPMLWATALGVLQGIKGEPAAALETLRKASAMKGTPATRDNLDNFILWALLLNSGKGNAMIDREFAATLQTYFKKVKAEAEKISKDYSRTAMKDRRSYLPRTTASYDFLTEFLSQEVPAHFFQNNQPERAFGFMAMLNTLPSINEYDSFYSDIRDNLDRQRPIEDVKRFLAYSKGETTADNPIDKLLQPGSARLTNFAYDAIGTRLIREGKFEEALEYLTQVDPRWIRTMPTATYMRDPESDCDYYSFRRTNTKPDPQNFYSIKNFKALFCGEMIENLNDYNTLKGDEKAKKALDIAAACHFASPLGDGWALSEYSWSADRPMNAMVKMAKDWTAKALVDATSPKTKMMANYARLALPSDSEGERWAFDNITVDGKLKYFLMYPTQAQLTSLDYICNHWQTDDLPYHIRQCDVIKVYMAGNFIERPSYYN